MTLNRSRDLTPVSTRPGIVPAVRVLTVSALVALTVTTLAACISVRPDSARKTEPAPVARATSTAIPSTSPVASAADPILLTNIGPKGDAESSLGPNGLIQGRPNSDNDGVDITSTTVADGAVQQASASVPVDWNVLNDSRFAIGAQQNGSDADFVVAAMHHQNAEGLKAESWSTTLQHLDAGSSTPGDEVVFAPCKAVECQLSSVNLFGHVALLAYLPGTDAQSYTTTSNHVAAIDLDSGAVLWDRSGVDVDGTTESAIIVQKSDPTYQGDTSVSAIDPRTGATGWTFHDARDHAATGFIEELGNRYALLTSPFTGADGYAGVDTVNVVDLQDGSLIATRYGHVKGISSGFDPVTGRIALAGISADPKRYRDEQLGFEVLSTAGATVLAVSAEQWAKLDRPTVLGAHDGRIWLDGQNGVDLITTVTGDQDPASPQLTGSSGDDTHPLYPSRTVGHLTVVAGPASYSSSAVVITASGDPSLDSVNGVALPTQ